MCRFDLSPAASSKSLTDEGRDIVQLDVLRPPTFKQLGETLRRAKKDGRPYHILHFDGHGMYAEVEPKIIYRKSSVG